MTRVVKSSALVVTALWVGVLFCLGFIVAPYLFILAAKKFIIIGFVALVAFLKKLFRRGGSSAGS